MPVPKNYRLVALAFAISLLPPVLTGCSTDRNKGLALSDPAVTTGTQDFLPANGPTEADYPSLHHLFKINDTVYSGGEPRGEEAFASLARLGVKTIISVDGATPDVDRARQYGLRYVHVPIGYDGIEEEAALSLTRVMKEAEGPMYFHCHHGVHRGPAAAAVACIAGGIAGNQEALAILRRAGTSTNYAGLWRDVESFQPWADEVPLPELVEAAEVGSFAAAMAQIDRAYDNLKLVRNASWSTPPDHPDISPVQEALLLRQGLRESNRNLADDYDERFKEWLSESEGIALSLEEALRAGDLDLTAGRFQALEVSCRQCHKEYRN